MHEAALFEDNCFLTLTYDDEHLPEDLSVDVRAMQLFLKRLRKRFGSGIRFVYCGEYGETTERPHYHAILFNIDFSDKKLFKIVNGNRLYTSECLNSIWSNGNCLIGSVSFESAAYVARYVLKKVTGKAAASHYSFVDSDGVVHQRKPEFFQPSRRPGVGSAWLSKFSSDVFKEFEDGAKAGVVVRGVLCRPPRFYEELLRTTDPQLYDEIKFQREVLGSKFSEHSTPERLRVREAVKRAQISTLKRSL